MNLLSVKKLHLLQGFHDYGKAVIFRDFLVTYVEITICKKESYYIYFDKILKGISAFGSNAT